MPRNDTRLNLWCHVYPVLSALSFSSRIPVWKTKVINFFPKALFRRVYVHHVHPSLSVRLLAAISCRNSGWLWRHACAGGSRSTAPVKRSTLERAERIVRRAVLLHLRKRLRRWEIREERYSCNCGARASTCVELFFVSPSPSLKRPTCRYSCLFSAS